MNDREFKKRLKLTKFVVNASSFEAQLLWEKFCKDAIQKTDLNRYEWEQQNPGCSQTIGELDGRPVCLSLFWNKINGIMILFYEATSQVVDHLMVEKWLKKNCCPKYEHGREAHCNAENFHLALHYIDAKTKAKEHAASLRRNQTGAPG